MKTEEFQKFSCVWDDCRGLMSGVCMYACLHVGMCLMGKTLRFKIYLRGNFLVFV
jgi:hypothetical protein